MKELVQDTSNSGPRRIQLESDFWMLNKEVYLELYCPSLIGSRKTYCMALRG